MNLMSNTQGQGTVEAAFVLPIIFVLILLLLQPGIVLYDYIVMNNAAAEGARLAATTSSGELSSSCVQFIRHRLSAIPQQDLFHVHSDACSWEIVVTGGESAEYSEVTITNKLHPLPLIDTTLGLLGATDEGGHIRLTAHVMQRNQPEWLVSSASGAPSEWVESWTR